MTTSQRIVVNQNNDTTLQITITSHDTVPADGVFNITGMQLDFYVKLTPATADTDPTTVHLSTTTGEITLTTPAQGVAQVFIARSHLQTTGNLWWRLDVTFASQIKTAGNGSFVVNAQ